MGLQWKAEVNIFFSLFKLFFTFFCLSGFYIYEQKYIYRSPNTGQPEQIATDDKAQLP